MLRDEPEEVRITKLVKFIQKRGILSKVPTTLDAFAKLCKQRFTPDSVKYNDIVIRKNNKRGSHENTTDRRLIYIPDGMSFKISSNDAMRIYNQIAKLLENPVTVSILLKDLDAELGRRMQQQGLQFQPQDEPQYLITGIAYYIPGPPPDDYQIKHTGKLLDALLLEHEQKYGINMEGSVAKFVGIVDDVAANRFVASGHLFTEDKQLSRVLIHGSHTHRLQFRALLEAARHGKLNLKYNDKDELTPKQLLELLVYVYVYPHLQARRGRNLWQSLMDNLASEFNVNFATNEYQFTCRSPDTLNSLLACFGKELALPNLQYAILNSHWRAAGKMVDRVKSVMSEKDLSLIPNSRIYTYCMEELEKSAADASEFTKKSPITLTQEQACENSRYRVFDHKGPSNIVMKSKKEARLPDATKDAASESDTTHQRNKK